MNNKNKSIIVLLLIGIAMFSIIQFIVLPNNQEKKSEFEVNQRDALTHDISSIMKYKSQFIGDNSNVANLFYNLPLNNIPMKFEINSDDYSLKVNYLNTAVKVEDPKLKRDLLYNSVVSMALIDNLSKITVTYAGKTFVFTRGDIEKKFGDDLSYLLNRDTWKDKVQNQFNKSTLFMNFIKTGGWIWKSILHVPGAQPTHVETVVLISRIY